MAPWVVPAIMAASAVAGQLAGHQNRGDSGDTANYWNNMLGNQQYVQNRNALELYNELSPARQAMIERGTKFLQGGLDYTQSPMWAPAKQATEQAYTSAMGNIKSNLPSGGMLMEALANADISRANQLSTLGAGISQDDYDKIYGLAFGNPQNSISTGGLNLDTSGAAMADATAKAGKSQGLGQLGQALGYYMGTRPGQNTSGVRSDPAIADIW